MSEAEKAYKVSDIEGLTNEDIDYIEDAALFFGISSEEACKRFLNSNMDNLVLDDNGEIQQVI